MVSWWKRLIISFVSSVVGSAVCGAGIPLEQAVASPHSHLTAMSLLTTIVFFDPLVIVASLCGWLVALPLVLFVTNVHGWRFWMFWVIGIGFGPAIISLVNWVAATRGLALADFTGGLSPALYVSAAISGFSSLIYLLLLRRSQTRAALRASAAVA